MAYLSWSADLDTGIAVIDGQHRQIVEMINQLHLAQQKGARDGVALVIEELVDYTTSHFAFEEAMLEEAGYVFSKAHKRVHDVFIKRVGDYRARFAQGEDIADELMSLLGRWLFGHIRNDDQNYVPAVTANLRRLAADKTEDGWLVRAKRRFFHAA
ncbi:bacteriohemerythrin [Phytopseudomonas dryadis]|uniref:Bacteriohemerythrin n=1 Tax=Phytopseudomonas dryadis TaxID=2487520 RepID=A0A4Q9R4X3_9GAMM|nr:MULTISPECIES: bacteriohemerythrin [Pseudomonas]TBU94467.1 bacteriohemerythrin [Pseudomonas dryadis]TBV05916.1 bacteriohemerythrin [Pseudomonas dryadis]TBV18058.1 bacteriohemerythrin [Pseudomonas sp. FRB 230]